jgi:hypothetical protein
MDTAEIRTLVADVPVQMRKGWVYASIDVEPGRVDGNVLSAYLVGRTKEDPVKSHPVFSLRVYQTRPGFPVQGRTECRRMFSATEQAIIYNAAAERSGGTVQPREVPVEPDVDPTAPGKETDLVKFTAIAAELEEKAERINSRLSISILVDKGWIIVTREPEDKFDLVYGKGYEGQPERCFRFQRGADLCGASLFSREEADRWIGELAAAPDRIEARRVHEKDYLREVMNGMLDTAAHMRAVVEKLTGVGVESMSELPKEAGHE